MRVEWYLRGSSDPEAVSGSSTKIQIESRHPGLFCVYSIYSSVAHEKNNLLACIFEFELVGRALRS